MNTIALAFAVFLVVWMFAYFAACAGAGRFLTPLEWLRQASCSNINLELEAIEWDGVSVYRCSKCGKRFTKPL